MQEELFSTRLNTLIRIVSARMAPDVYPACRTVRAELETGKITTLTQLMAHPAVEQLQKELHEYIDGLPADNWFSAVLNQSAAAVLGPMARYKPDQGD